MYHNAIWSAVSEKSDGGAGAVDEMRLKFVPVFEAHKVPLVLEFHDHVFKRTAPLTAGVKGVDGVVYLGDGALGVHSSSRELGNKDYIAKQSASNYVNVIRVLSNGTCDVTTGDSDGFGFRIFDTVRLNRRFQ